MDRISLYIFRHLFVATVLSVGVLAGAVWLSQSLRLLEVIVDGAAPIGLFFQLVALSMPHLVAAVAPLGMIGATIFTYNRLVSDSELIVMRAAGMSPMQIAKPAIMMAGCIAILSYALNLYVVPLATQQFESLRAMVANEYAATLLREGQFNDLDGTMTVYFQERDRLGNLSNILIHDTSDGQRPVTILARQGALVERGETREVVLFDGQHQEHDTRNHETEILHFDQYAVDFSDMAGDFQTSDWRSPRERFLPDLLFPDMENERDVRAEGRLIAEAHQRLATPLLAFAFVALALGIMLQGEINRRGMPGRVSLAVLAVVLVQAMSLGLDNVLQNNLMLFPVLYLLPVAGFGVGMHLLHRRPKPPPPMPRSKIEQPIAGAPQ
ncbi:LPS export ABC transporter permease LptF [Fodinicurvata sp. EGI_FJ10296]|uniref:LPS export ABC transporter permease LptF n=1 Tax=Fodinicurvata sp. EGI_FJ10296 TaxID=3231908 RepID=UPI003451C15F